MNVEEQLRILAARARAEIPPQIDVTQRVLSILSAGQVRPAIVSERPLMWLAAFASASAVSAVVFAVIAEYLWTDPLMEISKAVSWVMQ